MNAQNTDFSEIIKKLVSNPEALASIASILGQSAGAGDKSRSGADKADAEDKPAVENGLPDENSDTVKPPGEEPTSPFGADMFSSLLSNPELLSKLPAMAEAIKPLFESFISKTGAAAADAPNGSALPALASKGYTGDRRAALLHALKPYLTKEKSEAIDYVLKVLEIINLLGGLTH